MAAGRRGLVGAVVSSSTGNWLARFSSRPASSTCSRWRNRRSDRRARHLRGRPATDTFLAGARALGVGRLTRLVVEDAGGGGRRAGPDAWFVVGVAASGSAKRRSRARGPTSSSSDLSELLAVIVIATAPSESSRGHCVRPSSNSRCSPITESVLALSTRHIGPPMSGNSRRGGGRRECGHLSERVYEARRAALSRAGYGKSPGRQGPVVNGNEGKIVRLLVDDEPFDAPLREAARSRAGARYRAGDLRRTADCGVPGGPTACESTRRKGSSRFVQR